MQLSFIFFLVNNKASLILTSHIYIRNKREKVIT
jgi:hypothetical protein